MPRETLHQDRRDKDNITKKADSRLQEEIGEKRSGSDSNAHGPRKQSRLHEDHSDRNAPLYTEPNFDPRRDLNPHDRAGERSGVSQALTPGTRSAEDIKSMHTILADLTDDELKSLLVLPEGTHLVQGSKYIDLRHLENGEFTATSSMVAGPGHYYVAKHDTDYVLWNRLNQVDNPARLDESSEA